MPKHNVIVTGHHLAITDGLKEALDTRLNQLSDHANEPLKGRVFLKTDKAQHIAEAVVNIRGSQLVAKASGQDMYDALGKLSDRLETQFKKRKAVEDGAHRRDTIRRNPFG